MIALHILVGIVRRRERRIVLPALPSLRELLGLRRVLPNELCELLLVHGRPPGSGGRRFDDPTAPRVPDRSSHVFPHKLTALLAQEHWRDVHHTNSYTNRPPSES